jgi:hypothetical protein
MHESSTAAQPPPLNLQSGLGLISLQRPLVGCDGIMPSPHPDVSVTWHMSEVTKMRICRAITKGIRADLSKDCSTTSSWQNKSTETLQSCDLTCPANIFQPACCTSYCCSLSKMNDAAPVQHNVSQSALLSGSSQKYICCKSDMTRLLHYLMHLSSCVHSDHWLSQSTVGPKPPLPA